MDVSFLLVLLGGKKISLVFLFLLTLLVLYKHHLPPSSVHACMHAKSLQSCPTLCDPMGCSSSGSSVQGVFQARILEWVAKPSSRGSPTPGIEPTSHAPCTGRQVLLPLGPSGESPSSVSLSKSFAFTFFPLTESGLPLTGLFSLPSSMKAFCLWAGSDGVGG